jgi:hypothetical protein
MDSDRHAGSSSSRCQTCTMISDMHHDVAYWAHKKATRAIRLNDAFFLGLVRFVLVVCVVVVVVVIASHTSTFHLVII